MKITKMVYDLLMEQAKNKKLINLCLNYWFGNNPTEQQRQQTETYIENFSKIKTGLSFNSPEVKIFLRKFNGVFDPKKLKNIEAYTLRQIRFLLEEYGYNEGDEVGGFDEVFNTEVRTPEVVKASQELWYSKNEYLIIDEGDFRVYSIPTKEVSRNFGHYEHVVANSTPYSVFEHHVPWCTARMDNEINLWATYREHHLGERTFYFIIDETKSPKVEKNKDLYRHYLSALQITTGRHKYRLTPINNDGSDPVVDETQLFNIYPKLRGHLDKITTKEYDEETELGKTSIDLDYINEIDGSNNEFAIQPKNVRMRYIQSGRILSKATSWDVLTKSMKDTYIRGTTTNNMFERFGSGELLNKISQNNQELRSLNNQLHILGISAGIKALYARLLSTEYITDAFKSLRGNVSIYKSRRTGKYGLYDNINCEWLNRNGIVYNDEYVEGDWDEFDSEIFNTEDHLMITPFRKPTGVDNTAFMMFSTAEDEYNGYFVSYANWLKIKEEIDKRREQTSNDPEYDADTDDGVKHPRPKFDGNDDEQADLNEFEF